MLRETVLRLGPGGLAAVASEPRSGGAGAPTVLLLNSGAEPHFGPGRAWVVFARDLARRGYRAVRADFRAWGRAPSTGLEPVPYAEHRRADVVAMVRALEELRPPGPVVARRRRRQVARGSLATRSVGRTFP